MKQNCELCGKKARMHCESDQASLCWECDAKVHSANFLVAKHSRSLLCHVCQFPTPWSASGAKLVPTISVCDGCFDRHNERFEMDHLVAHTDDCSVNNDDDEDEDSSDDEEDADEAEEEEGENQVVPWSCDYSPPATSSSISGEESSADCARSGRLAAKRNRNDAFLDSDDEIGCASSARAVSKEEATNYPASLRPLKLQRVAEEEEEEEDDSVAESKSTAITTSHARLQKNSMTNGGAAAAVLGIC